MSPRLRRFFVGCLTTLLLAVPLSSWAAPLRVFIRAGAKTHGPNQHDHPRFLGDYTKLLTDRGLKVEGAMQFPTAAQLEATDVLVVYAADGMKIVGEDRTHFETFLKRGGGLVVIHDGVVAGDEHDWAKKVQGGSWRWDGEKKTKWLEGEVGVYFVDNDHPITRGISNFDWKDEVYNQLDMSPDVHVLATSFVDVFNIWPQLWTYEKTWEGGTQPYRAFVSIPGHEWTSFQAPQYRAILLRGIAWAGKRENADEFCSREELASLTYPEGGPVPAEKAVKNFSLHPEFNVTLAADEKVAEKIMSLDWDPKGRLWVVETPEYPGGRDVNKNDFKAYWNRAQNPSQFPVGGKEVRKPKDRISILTDTNGDGIMDHKEVFADGLELPTSLVFYKDGVIVSQAPDILWIRDTDGDGKADKIETLYTGWGTFDTHAVVNNLRWGPDGYVYGTVGYTRGHLKSGDGKRDFGDISAGVFRFRPDGSFLEQVAAGGCNTWGCEVAPDGEILFTTATCGEPICHVVLPERFLARGSIGGHRAYLNIIEENKIYPPFKETRQPYVQIDWVGAWTAAAGATIYDGGAWPAKWAPEDRYSFFMSEATMHLFHHEFLDPKGVTFQGRKEEGRKETEFFSSTDYWFRPIHSRVGPDGALYVVDFYNQIAVHNDTRGPAHGARNAATRPDRDHHFTRLWRIQHKEAHPLPAWKLDSADPAALVTALEHPNGWVRGTANRLLLETQPQGITNQLATLLKSSPNRYGRIQALYVFDHYRQLSPEVLLTAMADSDAAVRKNGARLVAERRTLPSRQVEARIRELARDPNERVQIEALMAMGSETSNSGNEQVLADLWPELKNQWKESAAVGAASPNPVGVIEKALRSSDPAFEAGYVPHLARLIAANPSRAIHGQFLQALAAGPSAADGLKQAALDAYTAAYKLERNPVWNDAVSKPIATLLANPRTAGSVLPLVVRWDTEHKLGDAVKPAVERAEAQLKDASLSDAVRGQIAVNLIGVRKLDASIVPAVAELLKPGTSLPLLQRVVEALGSAPDSAVAIVAAFPGLPVEAVEPAFGQIIKRSEASLAFLEAVAAKKIDLLKLGPARQHRLRTHPDQAVAKRANTLIDELKGPEAKEKDALIARLTPEVVKPGNVENGHKLFTANCAGCHQFKAEGRNLAPNLTGMGAHGPADLLVHIVDPNRLVEPNFVSTTIETKDDQSYDGIIDRENAKEVVLRNATGDFTIATANIKSRSSSGRSLMPEGFDQLGGEGLRDLLAYICADEMRFRMLDLTAAFTANSSRGLYITPENPDDSITFRSYGLKKVEDIPFDVVSPLKAVANVVVLRGGAPDAWSRKSLPQKVEVKVGVPASRFHILGGVAGWGFPAVGDDKLPVLKLTAHFAGGASQEIILRNGQEIADYRGQQDVPGSKGLPQFTRGAGQIRWHSVELKPGGGMVETLTLESYDNAVAPTLFSITAEVGGSPRANTAPATTKAALPVLQWNPGLKVLLIGGGASHDYNRFFNLADVAMLNASGRISANYLEPQDVSVTSVRDADVLVISANKAFPDVAVRDAIFAHVAAGKGLVLLHPGLWYNWPDWAAFNKELAGGGSRGHDRYGAFDVTVTAPEHPILKGVPATFGISDELYYFEPDATGTPIEVLATATSKSKNKTFPQVFVVKHPKTRIAGITLGHDGVAHSLDAYQKILRNSIYWSSHNEAWIKGNAN